MVKYDNGKEDNYEYNEYVFGGSSTSAFVIDYLIKDWDDNIITPTKTNNTTADINEFILIFDNGLRIDIDDSYGEDFVRKLIKDRKRVFIDTNLSLVKPEKLKKDVSNSSSKRGNHNQNGKRIKKKVKK